MKSPSAPLARLARWLGLFLISWVLVHAQEAPQRTLRLKPGHAVAGQGFEVTAELIALGDENSVGFSLVFDPTRVAFEGMAPSPGGRRLLVNTNRAAQGRVGVAVAEAPGRAFAVGVHSLAVFRLRAGAAAGTASLAFGDDPVLRETASVAAASLTTLHEGTEVTIQPLVLPSITEQPSDLAAPAGTNVSLQVTVAGSPPLSVRWLRDGVVLADRVGPSLAFAPLRLADAGMYRAVVANPGGSVTSAPARVTVLPPLVSVSLRSQPEPFLASAGETVRLAVQAVGTAPLTYQWQLNGADLPDAMNETLTLPAIQTEQAGNYRVVVSNPISRVTSAEAAVSVSPTARTLRLPDRELPAAATVEVPVELDAFGDENAVGFSVGFNPALLQFLGVERSPALGQAALNVQAGGAGLGKVGVAIARPPGLAMGRGTVVLARLRFLVGGTPGPTALTLGSDPVALEVADVRGRIRPLAVRPASWTILNTPPSITASPKGSVVRLFDPVRLEVAAQGSEPLYVRWFRNGQAVAGATNATLAFVATGPDAAGSYHAVVSNAVQSVASATATVEVRRVLRVGGTNVPTGSTVSLPVEALLAGTENALGFGLRFDPAVVRLAGIQQGGGISNASWILRTNGLPPGVAGLAVALPAGQRFPAGTQAVATLTFEAGQQAGSSRIGFADVPLAREVADADARIVAADFLDGQVSAYRMAPSLVRHPVPRETTVGDPVVFAVQAEGSLPMGFQWMVNGVAVSGATNRTFSIPSVQTNHAGNYSVQVVNPVAQVVSSNALLTVILPDFEGPVLSGFTFDLQPLDAGAVLSRSGTLRLNAVDPSGVGRVELYVDGTLVHSDLDGTDGFASPLDIERFPDGERLVEFRAIDSRSNPTRTNLPVRIALAPPAAVQLTAPGNGTVTSNRTTRVAGVAPLRTNVRFYRNGSVVGAEVPAGIQGQFESMVPLVEGTNDLAVAAFNRGGEGPRTTPVRVVVDTSLPKAPGGVRGFARAAGRVRLEWVTAADPVKGYVVYRSSQPFESPAQAVRVTPSPIPATAFEEVPPSEATWHYRVAQVSASGVEGLLSSTVSVVSDATPPTARVEYRLAGATEPVSGTVGRVVLSVTVEASEPTDGTPFLSLSVPGTIPQSVELAPASGTVFRGTLSLDGVLWEGTARATFSARDKAGNRGDRITAGDRIGVDTVAPRLLALAVNPTAPIRNASDAPTVVTLAVTLSEPPKPGTPPGFVMKLARSSPAGIAPLSLAPGVDARNWTVTFRLPADAGREPETATLAFDAVDALGNRGTEIVPPHQFEVFGDELPALAAPTGLVGRSLAAGRVALAWQGVPGAAGYRVLRKNASGTFEVAVDEVGTNVWTDLPAADGRYEYAVATVRKAADRSSVGSPGETVASESDRTPPARPLSLSLVLARNGVFARWSQPPGDDDLAGYALYRSATPIPASGEGLVPLITGIPVTQVVDPAPQPGQPHYAVAAIDRAGNVSPPSEPGYLNIRLVPPQQVVVGVTNADPPILTWGQAGDGIAGHDVFLGDESANIHLNRRGLVTGNRFVDVGYGGGARLYTVFAVDGNGQRSAGRTVPLPASRVALKPGAIVRRGLMNRLVYEVTLDADEGVERARWTVQLGGRTHRSEPFALLPRTPHGRPGGGRGLRRSCRERRPMDGNPGAGDRPGSRRPPHDRRDRGAGRRPVAHRRPGWRPGARGNGPAPAPVDEPGRGTHRGHHRHRPGIRGFQRCSRQPLRRRGPRPRAGPVSLRPGARPRAARQRRHRRAPRPWRGTPPARRGLAHPELRPAHGLDPGRGGSRLVCLRHRPTGGAARGEVRDRL